MRPRKADMRIMASASGLRRGFMFRGQGRRRVLCSAPRHGNHAPEAEESVDPRSTCASWIAVFISSSMFQPSQNHRKMMSGWNAP